MTWYEDSLQAIRAVYGDDTLLYVQCLAATSPMSEVKSNITLANKAFNMIKAGKPIKRFVHCHRVNLERIARGEAIHGPKTSAFQANLLGDSDLITIDRWIMRWAGYSNITPTKRQREAIAARIEREALAAGMSNRNYQAQIWARERGRSDSFANHMNYRLQLEF
jgi:hypothetical protein